MLLVDVYWSEASGATKFEGLQAILDLRRNVIRLHHAHKNHGGRKDNAGSQ